VTGWGDLKKWFEELAQRLGDILQDALVVSAILGAIWLTSWFFRWLYPHSGLIFLVGTPYETKASWFLDVADMASLAFFIVRALYHFVKGIRK
jgi:hypothetical protein